MVTEGFWIPADEAANELDLHLTRFELALEKGRAQASSQAQQDREAFQAKVAAEPDRLMEIAEAEIGGDAETMGLDLLRVLVPRVIQFHLDLPSAVRSEMTNVLVSAFVDVESKEEDLDGFPATALRELISGDIEEARAARVVEALRMLWGTAFSLGGEPESLEQAADVFIELFLRGFVDKAVAGERWQSLVSEFRRAVQTQGFESLAAAQDAEVADAMREAHSVMLEWIEKSRFGAFLQRVESPTDYRRSLGPFDVSETDTPEAGVDIGSLRLTFAGVAVQLARGSNGRFVELILASDDSQVNVRVWAAPEGALWPEFSAQLRSQLSAEGVTPDEAVGPYGLELRYRKLTLQASQDVRIVGIEGPGWLITARYAGPLAADTSMNRYLDEQRAGPSSARSHRAAGGCGGASPGRHTLHETADAG